MDNVVRPLRQGSSIRLATAGGSFNWCRKPKFFGIDRHVLLIVSMREHLLVRLFYLFLLSDGCSRTEEEKI